MRLRLLPLLIVPLLAALAWVEAPGTGQASARQAREAEADDAPAVPEGMEVQARGPVHEAYAEPTGAAPVPGPVVEKAPPEAIEEAPPEDKPEGEDVVWVPGYWARDEGAGEFLWVSGFWRANPPGRVWTPGHWQEVQGGHQWVSGYWAEAAGEGDGDSQQDLELLPEPPETVDRGPSVPAPAADYHYAPGVWVYRTTRYVWRPGLWMRHRPGWVWTNACYRWTPAGYIYVNGFYDRPILERGLLFAPVRFTRPIYTRRDFVYRPAYVVQPDFLAGSLFVSIRRPRFYFGNYFEPASRKRFVAWTDYRVGRSAYDANYSYYRVAYRKHPAWERGLTALYAGRFRGDIARPPVTLVQQTKVINNITVNRTTNNVVNKAVNITNIQNSQVLAPLRRKSNIRVTALSSLANLKPAEAPVRRDLRVVQMSDRQRKAEVQQVNRYRAVARERRAAEAKAVVKAPATALKAPVKLTVDLPKTTPPPRRVVVKDKPPAPPPAPKFDDKVTPRPRPKDKDVIRPKDKDKPPVRPKDMDKDKPPVRPKDRDKDRPPVRTKEKDKPPPVRPKDKDKPPRPKDMEKDRPPPVRPKEKEKDRPPPVRPKEKDRPPPPKQKEKDKPPPAPPPRPKDRPPPPKQKDNPPPRPKEKEKAPPPSPGRKEKDKAPAPKFATPPPPPGARAFSRGQGD
jgi:hypothetical protein